MHNTVIKMIKNAKKKTQYKCTQYTNFFDNMFNVHPDLEQTQTIPSP